MEDGRMNGRWKNDEVGCRKGSVRFSATAPATACLVAWKKPGCWLYRGYFDCP